MSSEPFLFALVSLYAFFFIIFILLILVFIYGKFNHFERDVFALECFLYDLLAFSLVLIVVVYHSINGLV